MERLQAEPWPDGVSLMEMNWPPLLTVQSFQSATEKTDRIVLVAGANRGLSTGAINSRRWMGGKLADTEMQERMVQGMTGPSNLDNLLIIGEHFGIWPTELLIIEMQITNNLFGAMATAHGRRNATRDTSLIVQQEPDPEVTLLIDEMFDLTRRAVLQGAVGLPDLKQLSADDITPLPHWLGTSSDESQTRAKSSSLGRDNPDPG